MLEIRDKATIIDLIRIYELLVIDWITIHFVKNSKKLNIRITININICHFLVQVQ